MYRPQSLVTRITLLCKTCADHQADSALVTQVENAIKEQVAVVKELSELASNHPYYKYAFLLKEAAQVQSNLVVYIVSFVIQV